MRKRWFVLPILKVTALAEACPNVTYLGFQQKETILFEMKQASALIFPSIWYEGFPMTIAEALSTGTPVIVSKIGGLSEIIQDGYNGRHTLPGDPADLVSQVEGLVNHPTKVKELAINARQSYLAAYTPESNYQQLMDIYHDILKHGNKLKR